MSSTSSLGRSMGAPRTALWGVVLKLPGRLNGLLHSSNILPKRAEEEILLIKRDLEDIIAILSNLEDEDHDNARMVRCWTKEVRELSYDMEDFIDQYEHASRISLTLRRRNSTLRRHFLKKGRNVMSHPWLYEKLRQRLWMANKIREFSLRVQEVLQRHDRYKLGGKGIAGVASTARCTLAPSGSQHHSSCGHDNDHVGISDAMNKLEEWLMTLHHEDDWRLKVVSIVGFGGVGKTTLANELYQKLGWQFDCRAFVRSSQKPDIRRLLISILSQIRPLHAADNSTVHGLISSIRTHLQDKRYFIIFDDLWMVSTWDVIKCALPDGNSRSRILTTTEIEDVALQSCDYDSNYVFKMQPLSEDNSRKLFFSTIIRSNRECPPELREFSYSIIQKCGGLPLAILTIANIVAFQLGKPEKWDQIDKSLSHSLMTNPTLEGMKEVLTLGYYSLPQHLKACMLYVGMFQENDIIWKGDLLNQWTAEGFFSCAIDDQDKECLGGYFDELVGRKMLQPVHINDQGEVLSCVIHRMVLNLVFAYKSIEENFFTTIHHSQETNTISDKVRRLSLQYGTAEDATLPRNMRLSQVRTLAFSGAFKCMPPIADFQLLQVLILHLLGDKESISLDLTTISDLFRLRYLKLTSNVMLELHNQIRCLQSLETLNIDARVNAVPSDIAHLPGLLNLNVPAETSLPNGIGQAISLHTLGYFDLNINSMENVQSLSQLTNLRDLQLTCSIVQANYLDHKIHLLLGLILGKLKNLKSITLEPAGYCIGNYLSDPAAPRTTRIIIPGHNFNNVSYFPALLNKFEFSPQVCIFSCLPKGIRQLEQLCILKIGVHKMCQDDIAVLGGLPALSVLLLDVHMKPEVRILIRSDGFSVLTYLKLKCCDPWLKFEVDSMPNLRRLKLSVVAHRGDQQSTIPVGMEHLSGLKEVSVKISGVCPDDSLRRAAELAVRDTIKAHVTFARVVVQFVNQISNYEEYQSSVTIEHGYGTPELNKFVEATMAHAGGAAAYYNLAGRLLGKGHGAAESAESSEVTQLVSRECASRAAAQYKNTDQEAAESSEVTEMVSRESASKRKDTRNPNKTIHMVTNSEEDGYSWRKYGQKDIPGAKYPIVYYRCAQRHTHGCPAKKTQRTNDNASRFLVSRSGEHTCRQSARSDELRSGAAATADEAEKHKEDIMRSSAIHKEVMRSSPDDDGYSWRWMYGQKHGAQHLRSYYTCAEGCPAIKDVQLLKEDNSTAFYRVVYQGAHTCRKIVRSTVEGSDSGNDVVAPLTTESMASDTERDDIFLMNEMDDIDS